MKTVTVEQVIEFGPCGVHGPDDGKNYTPQRIQGLFGAAKLTEASAVDILRIGPELGVSYENLLWLVVRPELIEPGVAAKFALLCAEYVRRHYYEAAQRCYLVGEVTVKELEAVAKNDVFAPSAVFAAFTAASDAVYAAGDAKAEARWQCMTLLGLLEAEKGEAE